MACLKKKYSTTWLSERSSEVLSRLEETKLFRKASCIAFYHALPGEVETADFIRKWASEKTFLLPVVEGDDLRLVSYNGDHTLKSGVFGILEPDDSCSSVPESEIDLFIIPGVAFDRKKNRLGRGKGYYDRLLSSLHAPKIGLCFDFQLHDNIPVEPFDIPMNGIITNREVIL